MERTRQLSEDRSTAHRTIAIISALIISAGSALAQTPATYDAAADFEAGWNAGTPWESENGSGHEEMAMRATPNPFTGEFLLGFDLSTSPSHVRISDMVGQVVEKRELAYPTRENILGSGLPAGAYLVEIIQGGERRERVVHKVQ